MDAYTGGDRIELLYSGGVDQRNPDLSLGGVVSSKSIKGLTPIYSAPVQGLIIEESSAANGIGMGSIFINGNSCTYTPPDGLAGDAVNVAEGSRKILTGEDTTKWVRIRRITGQTFKGTCDFYLKSAVEGVIAMSNVSDADRQAGNTFYRALFIHALAAAQGVRVWITTTGQASWALAKETAQSVIIAGSSTKYIQAIGNANDEPELVSWTNAVDLHSSLIIGNMDADEYVGIWIRKTFPASGVVALSEEVTLNLQFKGV